MTIAATVKNYLAEKGVDYEVIDHAVTAASLETAESAHISGEGLAKAVVLEDADGYLIAVIPATYRLELSELHDLIGRRLEMANEDELNDLFADCAVGAVPPVGRAYGIKVICDDALSAMADVYFEGGDHASLIHVDGAGFSKLMADANHGSFSHHM